MGDLGGIRDSQCGFKLMTLSAAERLYRDLYVKGWSHDVEVLYRASPQYVDRNIKDDDNNHNNRQRGVPVAEAPIEWEDQAGSKLVSSPGGVLMVCWKMFWDVVALRQLYTRTK